MTGRTFRRFAAFSLAAAMVLCMAAPARATDGTAPIKKVGKTVLQLLTLFSDGGLSPEEIAELVTQVVGAVDEAESAVISHMDAVGSAPWLGAAKHHIVEFNDIEVFEEEVLWEWAMDVTGDAETAASVFNALSDRKTADDLGYAIHTLYPIALTARTKAGFTTTVLMDHYRQALTSIVNKLAPTCTSAPGELDPHPSIYQVVYDCTTPDGRRVILQDYQVNGVWQEGPYTPESLRTEVGKDTSWAVAREVLQTMGN
jgi:hypothetical protein